MIYDNENGYAVTHTEETIANLNNSKRGAGRVKMRYDIIKRDGQGTIVHHDLTRRQVSAIRIEIERQGNTLW